MTGASADMTDALGKLLGVEIRHETVGGLPALLTGVNSGRYQFAFGPVGDYKPRQENNDFVDWVQEFVVFAVKKAIRMASFRWIPPVASVSRSWRAARLNG
ncbi:hypothetical protein ACFSS8_10330 [Paracoccus kondratievae]